LGLTRAEFRNLLDHSQNEWLEIWNVWALSQEDGFFRHSVQLEALGRIVQEWAPFAPARRLKVLSLGAGAGYEACSLAMALLGLGLTAKGWELAIHGLELVPDLASEARAAIYPGESLDLLPRDLRRRYFRPRAGGWRFEASLVSRGYAIGNPHRLENPPESLLGADLVVARGLSWDSPDEAVGRMVERLAPLFGPECLLLTAPGEFWPCLPDFSLEIRDGVTYYRRSAGRYAPKLGKRAFWPEPPAQPRAQVQSLAWATEEKLAEGQPEAARDLAVELIHEEAADGYLRPESLGLIEKAELALGRPLAAQVVAEVRLSL
jgi:chemotaxis methyl-accepting protein methylase